MPRPAAPRRPPLAPAVDEALEPPEPLGARAQPAAGVLQLRSLGAVAGESIQHTDTGDSPAHAPSPGGPRGAPKIVVISADAEAARSLAEMAENSSSMDTGRRLHPQGQGAKDSNHSEETPSEHSWSTQEEVHVDRLIENDVSQALVKRTSGSHDDMVYDFERFLMRPPSMGQEQAENSNSGSGMCLENSARSSESRKSVENEEEPERMLIKAMFQSNVGVAQLHDQHKALGRVIGQIFTEYELDMEKARSRWSMSWSLSDSIWCSPHIARCSAFARRVVDNTIFITFFMSLTIYALFCPDFLIIWGTRSMEFPFLVINTGVFVLYFVEMLFNIADPRPYVLTMVFVLDIVALLSIFTDTWFLRQDPGILDEKSSTLSRLARSTRLTRLARIARIARVTRMIPAVIRKCMKHQTLLARRIFLRRVWRAFRFLDADRDGSLSFFDMKFFYVSVLRRCPSMLQSPALEMLREDARLLLECENTTASAPLNFSDFSRVFLSTKVGKDMLRFQVADLERDAGVWTLVRKVSDRTALKLCVGILSLLAILQMFSTDLEDVSAQQGLMQLSVLAAAAHSGVGAGNGLCEHLRLYASTNSPLAVVLDGVLHWEDNRCLVGAEALRVAPPSTLDVLSAKFVSSALRSVEVQQLCWPSLECSASEHHTAALIDRSAAYREDGGWSLLSTLSVIILLLLYIYILNSKITQFSKMLLQPLRALLDDMVVLSNLDLADIDEDLPAEIVGKTVLDTSEELQGLQESFKTMRNAIRSWCKYVPPAVVQRLFAAGLEAKIGVVKCTATILFCDIDGFQACCEGLLPEEVLDLLSTVTSVVADVIKRFDGTLLEFIGDEVLAVYNTPRIQENHSLLGVLTALNIHRQVGQLTYKAVRSDREIALSCRCGVHTGSIFAGNIGSHQRMKYGLLGDGVNLTARLKGLNSRYNSRTLVSQAVHDIFAERKRSRHVLLRPVDLVAVKGKTQPTIVYESILAIGQPKVSAAYLSHTEGFRLYQKQCFAEAYTAFAEASGVLEALGSYDVPSRMLMDRCKAYIANPPAADWDGVERMTKKSFEDAQTEAPGAADSRAKRPTVSFVDGLCAIPTESDVCGSDTDASKSVGAESCVTLQQGDGAPEAVSSL